MIRFELEFFPYPTVFGTLLLLVFLIPSWRKEHSWHYLFFYALLSALDEFYSTPQLDPAFAERLEARLHQRHIELMTTASSKQKPGSRLPTKRSSFMHLLRTRPIIALIAVKLPPLLLTRHCLRRWKVDPLYSRHWFCPGCSLGPGDRRQLSNAR